MKTSTHGIVTLFLATFFVVSINAQEVPFRKRCYSHENLVRQMAEYPEMVQKMEALEHQTALFTEKNRMETRGGQITIPVVVHVIYRTDAENISTEQIQSQIDVLNGDYNKQNSDITKVPTAFASLVADCQINFQLASRDPKGNPTKGIVRYATTKTSWSATDDVKRVNKGGFANWDPSKYLNIYVCNIGGGILGYASFPNCPAYLDGVVVDYTAFGTINNVHSSFNKGRTCTHEVGHWLNLVHTWGDLDCGDDYVTDTPQQKEAYYGDVTTPQYSYCSGKPTRDMTMNFMDYVNDDCMFMFTVGQKTRIQALFASSRCSILNSDGCVDAPPLTCDLGKPTINNIKTTSAHVTWSEILGMKKYTVEYKMDGTQDWTVSQTSDFSLSFDSLIGGATYQCRVKGDCAQSDYSEEITFKTLTAPESRVAGSNSFAICPNPVVHDVIIMFDILNEGLVNVQLFNSNGILIRQVAKRITPTTPAVSFDLTELPTGFYLVVAEKDGQRTAKKVLKVNP